MGWLVGALSRGDGQAVARYRDWYGEELYASAKALWDNIQGRQHELRAQAMAVLAGQLEDEDVRVRGRAAERVIAAIDVQNVNRNRFADLRDPNERRAAVEDMRLPDHTQIGVLREAWEQPCLAVLQLVAHVVQCAGDDRELASLLGAVGWARTGHTNR